MADAERKATGDAAGREPRGTGSAFAFGPESRAAASGHRRGVPPRRSTTIARRWFARAAVAATAAGRWLAACLAEDREAGRGFLWLPVGFGVGVALYFGLSDEPNLAVLAFVAGASAALSILVRTHPVAGPLSILATAVAVGAVAAKLELVASAAPLLDRPRTETVTGFVEAIERRPRGRVRLVVRVVDAGQEPSAVGTRSASGRGSSVRRLRRVVVTAAAVPASRAGYADPPRVGDGQGAAASARAAAASPPGAAIAVGQGVTFRARLAPPRAPILPGGYDAARAAIFEGIGATGFVYGRVSSVELGPAPWPLPITAVVAEVRADAADRIRRALPGDAGEVAAALLVGERGGIPERIEEEMRVSGLAHVLSISGLHMVLVAGTVFALVRAALALFPALALTRPIKSWAAVVAALAATAYLVVSGAEVATQRAYVTILVTLAAVVVGRPAISLRTVAVAAIVVMALSPSAVLGAGFQMSFAAVVALVAVYEALTLRRVLGDPPDGWIARLGRAALLGLAGLALTSLVAGLATAPIAAYHFHRGAPLGLLANLMAMPVVSILVMPFGVAALALMPVHLEGLALAPMGMGIEAMLAVARWVTSLTGGSALVGSVPAVAPLLLVAALLWAAITVAPWRVAALAPLIAGLLLLPTAERPDLLVSGDGRTVAVRGDGGHLVAVSRGPDGDFVLRAWLAADADERRPDDPSLGSGARCDALGCTAPMVTGARRPASRGPEWDGTHAAAVNGTHAAVMAGRSAATMSAGPNTPAPTGAATIVAVARDPLALLDDCGVAAVTVAAVPRPAGCDRPRLHIGPSDLRGGTVAIRWPEGIAGPAEVAAARPPGWRPWYGPPPPGPEAAQ